jgi:hypothetical protein
MGKSTREIFIFDDETPAVPRGRDLRLVREAADHDPARIVRLLESALY